MSRTLPKTMPALRRLIRRELLSLKRVARLGGISQSYLSRVLLGHHKPKPETLRRVYRGIALALDERDRIIETASRATTGEQNHGRN